MLPALLLGLLGSLGHCVGMCSAMVVLLDRQPAFQQNRFAWPLAHAGRILSYSILGFVAGALGQTLWSLSNFQAGLSILFSIFAFLMAAAFAGLIPSPERLLSGWTSRWGRAMRGLQNASRATPILLGLLWGLLPCGLVLTALLMAASAVDALLGALTMFVFGIATVPSLFTVKWLAGRTLARQWGRVLASLAMMVFGFQFAMRGFAALGWVNHFMLGSVMFW